MGSQVDRVIEVLRENKDRAMTASEVSRMCGAKYVFGTHGRIKKLVKFGLVRAVGTAYNRNGRLTTLWQWCGDENDNH